MKENTAWKDFEEAGEALYEKHPVAISAMGYGLLTGAALAISWFFSRSVIVSAIKRAR